MTHKELMHSEVIVSAVCPVSHDLIMPVAH